MANLLSMLLGGQQAAPQQEGGLPNLVAPKRPSMMPLIFAQIGNAMARHEVGRAAGPPLNAAALWQDAQSDYYDQMNAYNRQLMAQEELDLRRQTAEREQERYETEKAEEDRLRAARDSAADKRDADGRTEEANMIRGMTPKQFGKWSGDELAARAEAEREAAARKAQTDALLGGLPTLPQAPPATAAGPTMQNAQTAQRGFATGQGQWQEAPGYVSPLERRIIAASDDPTKAFQEAIKPIDRPKAWETREVDGQIRYIEGPNAGQLVVPGDEPTDIRTNLQKEYDRAKLKGDIPSDMTLLDFDIARRSASSDKPDPFREMLVEELGEERAQAKTLGNYADSLATSRQLLFAAMKEGKKIGGPVQTYFNTIKRYAADVGVPGVDDDTTMASIVDSVSAYNIPRMRVEGSGSTSDTEIRLYERATTGPTKSDKSNYIIAWTAERTAQMAKDRVDAKTRSYQNDNYAFEYEKPEIYADTLGPGGEEIYNGLKEGDVYIGRNAAGEPDLLVKGLEGRTLNMEVPADVPAPKAKF